MKFTFPIKPSTYSGELLLNSLEFEVSIKRSKAFLLALDMPDIYPSFKLEYINQLQLSSRLIIPTAEPITTIISKRMNFIKSGI